MMDLAPRAHAVMLLTVSFGRAGADEGKPLSAGEWADFAFWLERERYAPEHLLGKELRNILAHWSSRSAPAPGKPTVTAERVEGLLARGMALGVSLERWERAGLWVVTRSDSAYPDRLRKRLRRRAPPVLFGCGNGSLVGTRGIAVVGSRNAAEDDLGFAESFGRRAAEQGYSVVSGAARGVDEHAMLASLRQEGTVIGVVGDSLLRSATSQKYREHLAGGNLVLVSPFQPETRFRAWQAMERNKYIYCLSDAAVVACSKPSQGGTWNGAIEALRAEWVPVWLRSDRMRSSGNAELAGRGGRWLPDRLERLDILFGADRVSEGGQALGLDPAHAAGASEAAPERTDPVKAATLYHEFLKRLASVTRNGGASRKEIADQLELTKSQVDAWIRRGLDEGQLIKQGRPVRYRLSPLFATGPSPDTTSAQLSR
ncbi:MAG: DNA-processing protein DprA [Thiotrichales bacterium]|nr:DNA-processing protein DprA [Thiotrichales bacterium]